VLHAFSYTVPKPLHTRPTLVVAGAGELRDGILEEARIIHPGDIRPDTMRAKAIYVMGIMEERLQGLGGTWDLVTAVDVYTVYLRDAFVEETVLPRLGAAQRRGVCWHYARPPIIDIDFEMDMRGVCTELWI